MSYTREQRAAKAAQAAQAAQTVAKSVESAGAAAVTEAAASQTEPAAEPSFQRPESRNPQRENAFKEIEAREQRQRDEAAGRPEVKREEPAPDPVEPAPAAAVEPVAAPQAAAEPAATPAVEMVRVKVDGEEFEVSKADIDAAGGVVAYQKDRASENRLRKTNDVLAQTRQTQAQIAQLVQQLTPKQPTQTDAQFIQSKIDLIRFGSPEESAAALQEVMSRGRSDENMIIQRATMHMQQKNALDIFGKEFQDVINQPLLSKLATALEVERIGKLPANANLVEFYRKIGNEVRSVAGPRPNQTPSAAAAQAGTAVAVTTADSTSPASEKEARKASIVNLPTAAARATPAKDPQPESREDILNQMRKSRGLPTG